MVLALAAQRQVTSIFGSDGKVCEGWTRIGESWYFLK